MAEEDRKGVGSGPRAVRGAGALRGRSGVAASILGVLLIGGYFAASRGDQGVLPTGYLISAAVLVVAFWFPAMRIGSVGELRGSWLPVLVWLAAWTLVWDLAVTGVIGERELFEEWWIVYPSGVLVLGALLALHGVVVERVEARRGS